MPPEEKSDPPGTPRRAGQSGHRGTGIAESRLGSRLCATLTANSLAFFPDHSIALGAALCAAGNLGFCAGT